MSEDETAVPAAPVAPGSAAPAAEAGRVRSAKRQFAAATLTFEAFVVVFAALVAQGLEVAPPAVIWAGGGSLALVCILLAGMLRAPGAYVAGSVVQVLVIAGGIAVPLMFVVGGIFALLWVVALRLGGRIDRERAERAAAEDAPGPAADAGASGPVGEDGRGPATEDRGPGARPDAG